MQYVEGAADFCAGGLRLMPQLEVGVELVTLLAGCMSAIDMYNRRKGYEQRRLTAADERFRILDMMGRVSDAGVQTEDGFDEALLKDIGMQVEEEFDEAGADQEDADGGGTGVEQEEEDVAAATKALDAAADEAREGAAAAFADDRCGDD